jgi:hypothetical protein
MHKGKRAFKARGRKNGSQGLTGLGRVNGEGLPRKVLLTVVPTLGPFSNASDFFGAVGCLKFSFGLEQLLILWLVEEFNMVFDLIDILSHD